MPNLATWVQKTIKKTGIMKKIQVCSLILSSLMINSFSANAEKALGLKAYYGDYNSNRVFVIDVNNMALDSVILNTGMGPYEVDYVSKNFAYVVNRDDTQVDIVQSNNNKLLNPIHLDYTPRSIVNSPNDRFGIISGKSEPWSSLINLKNNRAEPGTFKDSSYQMVSSFGGGNATGHPFWVTNTYFLMLDRTENAIELYSTGLSEPLAKLITSSSVHHIFKSGSEYFAALEGQRNNVDASPGLIKFSIDTSAGELTLLDEKLMATYSNTPDAFMPATWGGHHASLHPDGQHIYFPSYEGTVFVVNKNNFALVDTFVAGTGAGHVTFIPDRDLAIVTNHNSTFKTILNSKIPSDNIFIKNLEVAEENTDGSNKKLQSHTSHTGPDGQYFYSVSSRDGVFYSIDLDTLEIAQTVDLEGAYALMGALVINNRPALPIHNHK